MTAQTMTVLEEALRLRAQHDVRYPDERDRIEWWMPTDTWVRLARECGMEDGFGPERLLSRPIHIDDTLGGGLVMARTYRSETA